MFKISAVRGSVSEELLCESLYSAHRLTNVLERNGYSEFYLEQCNDACATVDLEDVMFLADEDESQVVVQIRAGERCLSILSHIAEDEDTATTALIRRILLWSLDYPNDMRALTLADYSAIEKNKKQLNIRTQASVLAAIDTEATKLGVSRSLWICWALISYAVSR